MTEFGRAEHHRRICNNGAVNNSWRIRNFRARIGLWTIYKVSPRIESLGEPRGAINNCRTSARTPGKRDRHSPRDLAGRRRAPIEAAVAKVASRGNRTRVRMSLSMRMSPCRINTASAYHPRMVTILIYYRRLLEATCHRVLSETAKHLSANNRLALAETKSLGLCFLSLSSISKATREY